MKTEIRPRGVLRPAQCRYGLSKLPFRGPMRRTDGRYIAFIGGSETFAKYIYRPFPDLVETAIGEVCVNLGCQSAGPDVFLHDTAIQLLCHDAVMTVIQILGATNLANSFYKVHPRRNDRFIAPTDKLVALYPEIDFAEISFTGHLIARLRGVDEGRFEFVKEHLQRTWLRRMKTLIGQSGGPVVLLSLTASKAASGGIGPAFVTGNMIAELRRYVSTIVEVSSETGQTDGVCFAPLYGASTFQTLNEAAHADIAKALRRPLLRGLV